jgi:hypothetical protein
MRILVVALIGALGFASVGFAQPQSAAEVIAQHLAQSSVTQWDRTDKSMHDYISEGYELKAKSDNSAVPAPTTLLLIQMYMLQKAGSMVKCHEYSMGLRDSFERAPAQNSPIPDPVCFILTQPSKTN